MNELERCPYCKRNRGVHHGGYCSEYCRDMADMMERLKEVVKEIEKELIEQRESSNTWYSNGKQAGFIKSKLILYKNFPELKKGKDE